MDISNPTCYCRRNSHVMGSIEKCYGAKSWVALKNERDTMREAIELLLQDGVFDVDAAHTVRKARAAIGEVADPGRDRKCS